ncbi:MAG: alpha/beta hydrolase [Acutalibacteraceae bacterium]|nr:alpha/beta hydrolase [Acutalibacteraceae bacterium]
MSLFKRKRKIFIITVISILVVAIITVGCAVYLGDYYHADTNAVEAFAVANTVQMQTLEDNTIIFEPEKANAGFIFYPGGKVEYTAYAPLMKSLADKGVFCALVEMPFNLAVFDINAADGIQKQYPQIKKWYIGGHSLGGSMAAAYLSEHTAEYDGLILLGSYSTADLSDSQLDVISVYGSEDKILNQESYSENRANLPDDFSEIIIDGGCHSYFGMYGAQNGDGTPSITIEEQIEKTVNTIVEFINP